ncbi:MAG: hypothetical protein KME30_18760 [Iphinoe sp. HA4291-MV1]|jgi:hypothetical protein|nr:hypothetical protein [Iphinoe sp. HA4291-MV1]
MQLSPHFQSSFPIKISAIYSQARKHWLDILLVVILAAAAAFASYQGAKLVNPIILQTFDVWFDADSPRVFANMTERRSDHYRVKVHPLFSLIAFPPVFLLVKILSIEPMTAVRLVIAAVAALSIAALFILLRLIGCYRFDAMLFSLVAATSASAVFFFVIPETHSFGALSFLLALCFVAITQHRKLSQWWYVSISTLTLSFTTTNWMTGILATLVNHRWKRALQITVNAFSLVVVLWTVQKIIFPTAVFFLGDQEDKKYLLLPESGGPLHSIKSFVFHSMVMPAIQLAKNPTRPDSSIISTQLSLPGSGSLWGAVAVFLWAGLLALGLWALFSLKQHLKLRIVLGLTLLAQLAMHSVLYAETFLYSLHFGPLLVVLAALSTLRKSTRLIALVLAGTLVLTAGVNNVWQFNKATAMLTSFAPERFQVMGEMQTRTDDPWPRGKGHVVLATPGTREVDKAYHEPGGSFSPSVGSFGVSLWITDQSGNIQTTSDTIDLKKIQQKLIAADRQYIPAILTDTSYYRALWSSAGPERWTANLQPKDNKNTKTIVVIRSVGPAGAPIRSMDWNGKRLLINDRWSVTLNPAPIKVYLGEEGRRGWKTEAAPITQWKGSNGWGYARLELADGAQTNLVIEDSNIASAIPLNLPKAPSTPQINLPDEQFTASVHAQVAHLMMSLVNRETRPGEPTNYPLPWLRDGSYVVVALARAGELEVAKQLSTYFAENDFFGGFGPEADAPGLSLRALTEVADQLNQPEYDRWLWPHVRRKAELILEMLSTKQSIYRSVNGPIVPIHQKKPDLALVAEPAKNGLIVGRMDWHRPILYINAVSYRGLLDAASLADRVNQPADAERWRKAAAKLKQAWEAGFKPPESDNERTYMSSLWPTWIATDSHDALLQGLQKRWTQLRDAQDGFRKTPLWTYFDVAEAHQWLFLNQQERTWKTLRWFWNNQASPGLYTWWEGNGEENTFERWEKIRGWVKPPHVTPNYWTASEMLLLQLDMLAYTDLSAKEPTVVIGAGIPAKWLNKPMSVKGLAMANGKLDWNWNGKQMDVKIRGEKVNVRLGAVFPANTPLKVEYLN